MLEVGELGHFGTLYRIDWGGLPEGKTEAQKGELIVQGLTDPEVQGSPKPTT